MKSDRFWIIILAAVAVMAATTMFLIGRTPSGEALQANIYSEGELIRTIDLSPVSPPFSLTVNTNAGFNTIEAERGRIRVADADCRDGTCIRRGWVSKSYQPIVCLPHTMVIQIEGKSDIDGVVR